MTFESFKEIHKDKPPIDKFNLLREQTANTISDILNKEDARKRENKEEEEYWRKESIEMAKRMDWLFDELKPVLSNQ